MALTEDTAAKSDDPAAAASTDEADSPSPETPAEVAPDAAPGVAPEVGPEDTTRQPSFVQRHPWVVGVAGVVVTITIAVAMIARTAGDGSSGDESSIDTSADFFGARDDFDRDDNLRALGSSPEGQAWIPVTGTWGVQDHEAYVVEPRARGYNVAVVNMRSGSGSIHVTMPKVVKGAGLVFRYRNPFNFWMVTASPKVGTWTVQKVVSGDATSLGGIGLAPIDDGTTIGVDVDELGIDVSVNGRVQKSFADSDLQGEPRVGLVGFRKGAGKARWSDFVAEGRASTPEPLTPAPPTSLEPPFVPDAGAPPPPAPEEPTTEPLPE